MRACQILSRILIDNLHSLKHTWNSNVDVYHGKWAFMPSSVLELLPNFKSTYFASMNPPNYSLHTCWIWDSYSAMRLVGYLPSHIHHTLME